MAQKQQHFELHHKAELFRGKKTQDDSVKLETRVAVLEAKTDVVSNKYLFPDQKAKMQ